MKPTDFKERNIVYGENQKEYENLYAHRAKDGVVTIKIELSEEEKKKVAETGVVWAQIHTFNQPIQPLRFDVEQPDMPRNIELEQMLEKIKADQEAARKKDEENGVEDAKEVEEPVEKKPKMEVKK